MKNQILLAFQEKNKQLQKVINYNLLPVIFSLIRPLLFSIAFAGGFYVVTAIASDLSSVAAAALQLGVLGWLVVLSLSLLNYLLRFLRWHWYLSHFDVQVPWLRHLIYYFAGFAFTTTPGKAGEAIRSLYLSRHGVTYRHSLAALFVERLLDLAVIAILAMSAAWFFVSARWLILIGAVSLLGLVILLFNPIFYQKLTALQLIQQSAHLVNTINYIQSLLRASKQLLQVIPGCGGLTLGLIAWGAEGIGFFIILEHLETQTPLFLALGIYAAGILAGALSFIPGGLGSTEAVMVLLLGLTGVTTPIALAATLLCRLATLWFAVILGLVAVVGIESSASRVK